MKDIETSGLFVDITIPKAVAPSYVMKLYSKLLVNCFSLDV
eukprot:gene11025-3731_t